MGDGTARRVVVPALRVNGLIVPLRGGIRSGARRVACSVLRIARPSGLSVSGARGGVGYRRAAVTELIRRHIDVVVGRCQILGDAVRCPASRYVLVKILGVSFYQSSAIINKEDKEHKQDQLRQEGK